MPRFHERVALGWGAIQEHAAAAGGPLAVVTHGLVCRDLVAHHLIVPPELAAPGGWSNTCLTTIEGPPWTVRLLACTAHLEAETLGRGLDLEL